MRNLCRIILASMIVGTNIFAAEIKVVELPEPDLDDGYSFSTIQKWWPTARSAVRSENNSPRREVCKAYLLMRVPRLARDHRWKETEVTEDPLPPKVFAAIRRRETQIASLTNMLDQITYQQPGFRTALLSKLDLKELRVMTRHDYDRTALIPGSVVVWMPQAIKLATFWSFGFWQTF